MEQIEIPVRPAATVFRISRDELKTDFHPYDSRLDFIERKADGKRFLRWSGDGCTTFSWNRHFLFTEAA